MTMLPNTGAVLGLDVGFSPKRASSAVCRLDWKDHCVRFEVRRFRWIEAERTAAIGRVADGRPLLAAAFDGPLKHGLCEIGVYRQAERMLTLGFGRRIGKPGQSSAPVGKQLNAAANVCAQAVIGLGLLEAATHGHSIHERAICEAFPSAFLGVMLAQPEAHFVQRGNRSDVYFDALARAGDLDALVTRLLPGHAIPRAFSAVTDHDERAAVVCALTALCVAAGDYTVVGDEHGWIVLPPRDLIQPWALEILLGNDPDQQRHAFASRLSAGVHAA